MCLAIPGKIKKVDGNSASFDYEGHEYMIDVSLISDPKEGEWILMHDGRAMSKISEEEAKENLEFLKTHQAEQAAHHHH